NFTTTNTVLAIQNQPHCRKPLIQTERRILEDSPDLHRELPFRMPIAALPAELILEEADLIATADRAGNAVLPLWTAKREILQAVLRNGEVEDRFLKALRFVGGFHDLIVPWKRVLVKYINAPAEGLSHTSARTSVPSARCR